MLTSSEITTCVRTVCVLIGDPDRDYTIEVTDKRFELSYVHTIERDSEMDPQISKDDELLFAGHYEPVSDEQTVESLAVRVEAIINEIELKPISYE